MGAHDVSVVVPACNVERFLEQCLGSISSSLGRRLQVIVVDDGSTDATRAVAERFIAAHAAAADAPDFELITKPNGGYGSAVNLGIEHVDGTYVGIVESDDYLDGDQFGALFGIACQCDLPDIVKSTYKRVWMSDTSNQRVWHSLLRHRGVLTYERGTVDLGAAPLLVRYHPSIWSAIYRRDFLQSTGTRFIEAPGGGWVDNPFSMRVMSRARRIAYTDDAWYCYREDRPGSSSVTQKPELPMIRWQQMADELAQSPWATDPGVLRAFYAVPFKHLSSLWGTPAHDEVADRERAMLRSMDPKIVMGIPDLSPAVKRRYLEITGYEATVPGPAGYAAYVGREFVHSVRENGVEFALIRAGIVR